MANLKVFKKIMADIVKKFWPWFQEVVWPFIKEHVIEILLLFIGKFKAWIEDWFEQRSQRREHEAEQRAEEAEASAQSSKSEADAETWRRISEVWREVAEQHRRDLEDLKSDLRDFEEKVKSDAESVVDDLGIDMEVIGDAPTLLIGDGRHELPESPS